VEIEKEVVDEIKGCEAADEEKDGLAFNYRQWRCPVKADRLIDCAYHRLNPCHTHPSKPPALPKLNRLLWQLGVG
jgi:hypothetical protein